MSLKLAYLALVSSSQAFDFDYITNSIAESFDNANKWVDDREQDLNDAQDWVVQKKNDAHSWVNDQIDTVHKKVGDHLETATYVAKTVKEQTEKVNLMEEKLSPLSYADVVFHKTLLQLIFDAVYHHQEQGPQPEDVNFDYDAYFKDHTVIEDDQWDNELPVLMYHGITMDCDVYLMTHLHEMFEKINQQYGKNIYSECLRVGTPG